MFKTHGERLCHRREIIIKSGGNFDQEVLVQQHIFAEPAGAIMAEPDHGMAASCPHDRDRCDSLARLDGAFAARAIIDNLTHIFMPRHKWSRHIKAGIGTAKFL